MTAAKCCLAVVLAVLIASATASRLETVTKQLATNGITYYSINLEDIFTDTRLPDNSKIWGAPLPAGQSSPQSDRVLNLQWVPPVDTVTFANNAALTNIVAQLQAANRFVLTFSGLSAAERGQPLDVKFEAPYLEVDPATCAAAGAQENCRCNPTSAALVQGQQVRPYLDDADKIVASTTTPADAAVNDVEILPGRPFMSTFFEHAPFVGQNPFARTYRRMCYRIGAGDWIDTRVLVSVTQGCLDGTAQGNDDTTLITSCANKNNTFLTVVLTGGNPRFIDPVAAPAQEALRSTLGSFFVPDAVAPFVRVPDLSNVGAFVGESGPMLADRLGRTTCCGASAVGVASPLEVSTAITVARFGVCIDPTTGSCCGRRAYTSTQEKCCSRLTSRIRYVDQPCPCAIGGPTTIPQQNGFCQFQGPNVFATDDRAGATQIGLSTTYTCCAQTRFPDLNTVVAATAAGTTTFTRFQRSFCVDSLGSDGYRCCSDGNVYDVGSQQCCEVTGVQTLNLPCPCGTNADCPTGSGCCFQIFPPGLPRGQGASQCSRFANYPRSDNGGADGGDVILSQPANPSFQRCPGTCYDLTYQMCCNGAVCESGFTRCCNDTCCNKFSETCQLSQRSPLNSLANSRDLGVYFEMCSRIELLSGRKAFFVFVLPAWLLLATAISLALVTVLARRATEHIFELTERAIVLLALFTVVLGCPFFFSPFYKNGIVIVLVGLVSILVAVARKRKASLFLVILLVAAIFYVINPFDGNIYFSITSAVPVYGARPESSLLEAAQNLWRTSENCVDFYDFFVYDPMHRDQRLDNPSDFTFGYCSRSYITALIIFAIALYVILLLLLLLAVFSLVKKLGIKAVEPIELEVAMEPEFVY